MEQREAGGILGVLGTSEEESMSIYNKVIDLQKLLAVWQRVRRNKPAAGVDNITWQ